MQSNLTKIVRRFFCKAPVYILLLAGAAAFLFPLLWMILTSLSPVADSMQAAPSLLPSKFVIDNYVEATTAIPFWRYACNTLFVCVMSVVGMVCSSVLVAYGFSRLEWKGREAVFTIVLATMVIPAPVVMVPLFVVFAKFGWVGSLKPLWVPTFCAHAFNIFLLRQFFRSIPKDLSDAARIDGCSEIGILLRVIVPLSRSAIMVVALFQFIASWNDFMGPLIYLTRQETFTLSLGLQFFQSQHGGTQWNALMAAATLMTVPIIILYFFMQKSFVEGLTLGGVKE
jgi:multiple sugar transport system permease protein